MSILSKAFAPKSAAGELTKDWMPRSWAEGGGARLSNSGVLITDALAQQNAAAFACRRAISESLAILPRKTFRELADDTNEPVKHQSLKCLRKLANPMLTSYNFFNLQQGLAISKGNAYAELQFDRNTGNVIAMWPLPPDKVEPRVVLKNRNPDLVYALRTDESTEVIIPKDRILHISGLGFDGVKGYPLMEFMANALGLSQALEDYSSLFFKQGAGINGYVTIPDNYTLDQITNMRTQLAFSNDGLSNAHRWKFLYESAKFQPAGATPDQAQMTDSKIYQVQEVARFHRMPLHKIQENSNNSGYSSLEQFQNEFVNDTLLPWITNWEQEINIKFFGDEEDDHYIKFNTNLFLRGDAKARSTFYRTMVMSGIMSRNEARRLEELSPVPGADELLVPLNMMEASESEGNDPEKGANARERISD